MVRWLLVGIIGLGLLARPATAGADIVDQLRAVPGLTVVSERPAPPPYRFFELTYRQPADHWRPWLGGFEQRLRLLFKSADRPMVLHTTGYNVRTSTTPTEPMRLIDGNQLAVEHRFFVPSRPDPVNWTKLDIWQAATDHHRLVRALKPIFRTPWISTGSSKGGMATVYHRRFYPFDVDGSIAYVAPNDVNNREDSAYEAFFERAGTDPQCRASLKALQHEALGPRRAALLARFKTWAAANGQTFHETLGSADRTLEFTVLDTPWTFWQVRGPAACPTVPAPPASADAIYAFIEATFGTWGAYTDQGNEPYIPYYFQAADQLGYPLPNFKHLRKVMRYRDLYRADSFVPRLPVRFQPWAMDDIDRWVRHDGSELLFVYGENDPWSAERFELGRGTRDSYVYTAPGAIHSANIARLTPADAAAATATLRRWAGVSVTALAPAERAAAPDDAEVVVGRP